MVKMENEKEKLEKLREIIGEIPSYMFPEIQEKKYLRFDSII